MAEAMIRTISGLSACLGTGSEASKGALLGVRPSNAVTTEVVTTNISSIASKGALLGLTPSNAVTTEVVTTNMNPIPPISQGHKTKDIRPRTKDQ